MGEQVEPDILHAAISAIAAINPLIGFVLFIGWHITLYDKIPEMAGELRGALERFEERVGSRKYIRYMGKTAGVFAKILPKPLSKPPENKEAANKILKQLKKLSNKEIKQAENAITKFVEGGSTKEFLDEIKGMFKIENSSEVLDLFINIKDLIIDKKILAEFNRLYSLEERRAKDLEVKLANIAKEFEDNLEKLGKNLQEFREDIFLLDEGFRKITPIYFQFYKSKGINDWKEGWKPRLEDVYANLDYKRKIIKDIEKEGNFLILGESGYSKTTTLYRIICDFCNEKAYTVVASLGIEGIECPEKIIKVIEGLLTDGKNVLVAIDNVHDKMGAFEIISRLSNYSDFERLKFVFTARLPEFKETNKVFLLEDDTRKAIEYSLKKNLITEIPIINFDPKEAEGFARKYYPSITDSKIEEYYKSSNNGHPILLKYLLTGAGKSIEDDIEDKYVRYIFDKGTEREDERKIKAALFSCILDLCGIKITDKLADQCEVEMNLLEDTILKYNEPTGTWETLHPIWNEMFLNFWYKIHIKDKKKPEKTVKQITDTIVSSKDEEVAYSLINSLTNIVAYQQELLGLFEPSLEVPDYIDEYEKARLYACGLGVMWYKLERFEKSLEAITKAIKIFEKLTKTEELERACLIRGDACRERENYDFSIYAGSYYMRGLTYYNQGEYDSAIKDYENAIAIAKNTLILCCREVAEAYYNRAVAHSNKGECDESLMDFTNASFIFLIRAFHEEDSALFEDAMPILQMVFNTDKFEHIIKFEAGVALAAMLRIESLTFLNGSRVLKDSKKAKILVEASAINEKIIKGILSKVKEKESALCASAKAVLTVLEGGDAEIDEINNFKDAAFTFLLNGLMNVNQGYLVVFK